MPFVPLERTVSAPNSQRRVRPTRLFKSVGMAWPDISTAAEISTLVRPSPDNAVLKLSLRHFTKVGFSSGSVDARLDMEAEFELVCSFFSSKSSHDLFANLSTGLNPNNAKSSFVLSQRRIC